MPGPLEVLNINLQKDFYNAWTGRYDFIFCPRITVFLKIEKPWYLLKLETFVEEKKQVFFFLFPNNIL